MIDLVHITNNLPLALVLIKIVSNTHGPNGNFSLRVLHTKPVQYLINISALT